MLSRKFYGKCVYWKGIFCRKMFVGGLSWQTGPGKFERTQFQSGNDSFDGAFMWLE